MKKKAKHICCILALMSVFTFSAGITALTASAEGTTTVNAETSVEVTQQVGEVKKLVAALESDIYYVNGIPYVDIVKEGTANGARSTSETVTIIPDLTVNASGYITKVASISGAVEIPEETEDGTTIVGISGSAFRNVSVTEVIIPATIKEIKSSAFNGCKSLIKVVFKSSTNVTSEVGLTIQSRAFFNCTQLVEVSLPKHLIALNTQAFYNATSLKNIYIAEGCAGYRNGTGGYAGVVYTTDQAVDSVETSYIWPIAKQKYKINLVVGIDANLNEQLIVAGGHAITLPSEVGNQTISGWYLDAEFTSEMYTTEYFVAESEDVTSYTLYAKIENSAPTNSYVLTFDLQGGTQFQLENPMVLPMGEELNLSECLPERDGYDFAGWYSLPAKNGNKIVDETGMGTSLSEDIGSMTLYAAWTAHRYTINFFNYDGMDVFHLELDYGSTINAYLPERAGYQFDGWFESLEEGAMNFTDKNNVFGVDAWRVEEDRTLDFYAHYRANQYDYSVYCEKCDEQHSFGKATYDQSVTIDAHCNHSGYELGGWEVDDTTHTESFVWKYVEAKVFNVVWEAKEYAITYIEDNVEIPAPNGFPTTYTFESNFTFPTLTRTGYNDVYLRDGMNNRLTGITPGRTDNLTLYIVKDNPVKVNVTLNYYGVHANEVKELTYGNTYTLPTDKALAGYQYDGWEDAQGNKLTNTNISNLLTNTTYYIRWIGTVTLKDENGDTIGTVDLQYGKEFSIEPYEKVGHTFNGWSTSQASNAYITDATGEGKEVFNLRNSLILYARTTANTYTITYHLNGGTYNEGESNPTTYTIDTETFTLVGPVYENERFMGWYDNPEYTGERIYSIPKGTTGDKDLYAKKEQLYTLQFSEDGYIYSYQNIQGILGETVSLPNYSNKGYTWSGYEMGASYTITGNRIFYLTEKSLSSLYNSSTGYYEIWTYNQLNSVRNYRASKHKLMTSITIPEDTNWVPIPTFTGTFDGNNYWINDLTIQYGLTGSNTTVTRVNYGLFEENKGTIKNLGISQGAFGLYKYTATYSNVPIYCGFIAAKNSGTISYCEVLGSFFQFAYIAPYIESISGSICGYNTGRVEYCEVFETGIQLTTGFGGGIVGHNKGGTITHCEIALSGVSCYQEFESDTADGYSSGHYGAVGGIVGYAEGGTISYCDVASNVDVDYNGFPSESRTLAPELGIIAGRSTNSTIYTSNVADGATGAINGLYVIEWETGWWIFATKHSWNQAQYVGGTVGRYV